MPSIDGSQPPSKVTREEFEGQRHKLRYRITSEPILCPVGRCSVVCVTGLASSSSQGVWLGGSSDYSVL
jgi:hypothetical protein